MTVFKEGARWTDLIFKKTLQTRPAFHLRSLPQLPLTDWGMKPKH